MIRARTSFFAAALPLETSFCRSSRSCSVNVMRYRFSMTPSLALELIFLQRCPEDTIHPVTNDRALASRGVDPRGIACLEMKWAHIGVLFRPIWAHVRHHGDKPRGSPSSLP